MKKKNGRPLFDGKNEKMVIQKLEEIWNIGGSDKEASFYADISPAGLSDYLKKHQKVTERKEALKNSPTLQARRNIASELLKGDVDTSKWYLEKKHSDEFSTKIVNEHKLPDDIKINVTKKYDNPNDGVKP